MNEILASSLRDAANIDVFNTMRPNPVKLSVLKKFFEDEDESAVDLLSHRHTIEIDEGFRVRPATGSMKLITDNCMIDYHLTVANSIGLGSLLPDAANSPWFCLNLNLTMPYRNFKGKHAMVGFDTKGRMLYIGQCRSEDVFLAMAPNDFVSGHYQHCAAGYFSGPSVMSQRHYRQMVMMMAHFLAEIPACGYSNQVDVYEMDLNVPKPNWSLVTNVL